MTICASSELKAFSHQKIPLRKWKESHRLGVNVGNTVTIQYKLASRQMAYFIECIRISFKSDIKGDEKLEKNDKLLA